jgi:hypothetical protein
VLVEGSVLGSSESIVLSFESIILGSLADIIVLRIAITAFIYLILKTRFSSLSLFLANRRL